MNCHCFTFTLECNSLGQNTYFLYKCVTAEQKPNFNMRLAGHQIDMHDTSTSGTASSSGPPADVTSDAAADSREAPPYRPGHSRQRLKGGGGGGRGSQTSRQLTCFHFSKTIIKKKGGKTTQDMYQCWQQRGMSASLHFIKTTAASPTCTSPARARSPEHGEKTFQKAKKERVDFF